MKKTLIITIALFSVFAVFAVAVSAQTELENRPNSNGNGYMTTTIITDYQVALNTSNSLENLRSFVHETQFNEFLYDQWYSTNYGNVGNTSDQHIDFTMYEQVVDYSCITICFTPYVNLGTYAMVADYHSLIQAILPFKATFPIDYVEISLRNINDTYGYTEEVFAYSGLLDWGTSVQRPNEEYRFDYTARPKVSNIRFQPYTQPYYPLLFVFA